ncbi:MAG: hypothetical protein FWF84_03645, partial [Kiritimatiellaeota bacterium]|nr:hypothetical protein [Kiritimatiellota bacterium]
MKSIAVLAEYGINAEWVVKPLTEAGFTVDVCPFGEIAERLETGRYNVVALGQFAITRQTKQGEIRVMRRVVDAVEAFVKKGGGAYIAFPITEQMPVHLMFERFGMEVMLLNVVQEEEAIEFKEENRRMLYTTAVHPDFADGVKGVWLPVYFGHATATRPLKPLAMQGEVVSGQWSVVSGEWFTILAGEKATKTKPLELHMYGLPGEDLKGYDASVPIMMAREIEVVSGQRSVVSEGTVSDGNSVRGRVVVGGIPAEYYLFSPNKYPLVRQLLTDGFDGRPSDGLALFINTLRWLGTPSAEAGTLGGAPTSPEALLPQVPRFPPDPPVRWATGGQGFSPAPCAAPWQGLIGARTAYSSGKGTVAEYVAKAKAAGHQFIVFLEEFAAMTAENYAALQKECEAFSTDAFLAVPGFTIKDCVGSDWFQYGYTIQLPKADILSDDGKIITAKPGDNPRNHRVESAHCAYIFGECNCMRVRRGLFRHAASPKTILQNRFADSISLVTWEDGKIIEDVRDQYPMLMDKGLRLNPATLALMRSPEDFDRVLASGWKTMILEPYAAMQDKVIRKIMATELEWWGMIGDDVMASPRFRFDSWQYGTPFQSISSGPVVRAWTMSVSERDLPYGAADHEIPPTADLFRVDVLQMRLRIHVTSECGLKEVVLRDGVAILRRWRCDGAKEFAMDLDILHDQQRQFLLEATDINGGGVVTSDYASLRRDWCEFYCADRNNPLAIGFEKDENGLAYGWSGNTFLTYNLMQWGGVSPYIGKWWFTGDMMCPVPADPANDASAPTDGGVWPSGASLRFKLELPTTLDPPEKTLMVNTGQEMVSPDVAIGGFVSNIGLDPNEPYFFGTDNTGFGLYALYPTRYVDVKRRAVSWRPVPHLFTTRLNRYDIRFKEQPTLSEPVFMGWVDWNEMELVRVDGTRERLKVEAGKAEGEAVAWRKGDALIGWADGARPAIFINDGVELLVARENGSSRPLAVRVPVEALPKNKDDVTRVQVIGFGGTRQHTHATDVVATLRHAMGLEGKPAYDVTLTQGKIRSQQ